MSVFYDLSKTPRNILNQAIVRAIVSENNGALFDPSDLSTLYQDAAGTTPVTAVEQPVGKIIDKSGNGNHATQSVTASRPTLSARYNLLTYSEDFTNAAWLKAPQGVGSAPVVTSGYGVSPIGTAADRVQFSLNGGITNNDRSMLFNIISTATGASYEQSVWLKTNDGSAKIVLLSFNGTGYKTVTVTGQWTRFSNIYVSIDTSRYFRLSLQGNSGTSDSADLLVWGAQQRLGEAVGPYQRVNTATDYDTDERYFKKFLRFDGIDDYLNLPYMGLYANGSASVVIGVTEYKQSANNRVFGESSTTTSAQYVFRNIPTGFDAVAIDNSGVFFKDSSETKGVNGATYIITIIDNGSSERIYRNSILKTGPYAYDRFGKLVTLSNTTIGGVITSSGLQAPSLMDLYGLIVTKSAITDAQRIACERHLSRKAGVAL